MYYDTIKSASNDKHIVCNLVPGTRYFVTEAFAFDTYYRYTLTISTTQGIVANSGGIIEFTPAELPSQGVAPLISGTDIITGSTHILETPVLTIAKTLAPAADEIGTTESGQLILAGGTPVTLSGIESITPADSYGLGFNLTETEFLGVADSGSLTASSIYAEQVTYTEKRIASGGPDLLPNSDLGASFAIPEPNDGIYYDKLSESDDNSFVRIPFPLPGFVVFSDVAVGVGNTNAYQGTIRSVTFKVRVRFANTVGSSSPRLSMRLFLKNVGGSIIAQYPIPLDNVGSVTEFQSPRIPVQIKTADIPNLGLGLQLRAVTYGPDLRAEISRMWVEIMSDSTEKVIG